jgi:protease I
MPNLKDLKVAILTENGFEQSELLSPKEALENAGVTVDVVSPQEGKVRAWNEDDWGVEVSVDRHISDADPDDYDGLVLPGGVLNPDQLRMNPEAVDFIKRFFNSGKPLAAICHGPQSLVDADVLEGRQVTSYPSVRMDLINAGARWVDQEVVVDSGLITSRSPKDLEAFNKKLLEELREGVHERTKNVVTAKT